MTSETDDNIRTDHFTDKQVVRLLNAKGEFELTSRQKSEVNQSYHFLRKVLDHEHRYKVVARSFFEFERELAEICLENMFHPNHAAIVQHRESSFFRVALSEHNDNVDRSRDGLKNGISLEVTRKDLLRFSSTLKERVRQEVENLNADSIDLLYCLRAYGQIFDEAHEILRGRILGECLWGSNILKWFFIFLRDNAQHELPDSLAAYFQCEGSFDLDSDGIFEGVGVEALKEIGRCYFPSQYAISYFSGERSTKPKWFPNKPAVHL